MTEETYGKRMRERRALLWELERAEAGVERSTGQARNRLERLGLTVKGERRDVLTPVAEGVTSPWFDENESRLRQKGGG